MKILRRNIDYRGRILRAIGGLIFLCSGAALQPQSRLAALICVLVALFLFLEAAGGWCAARACGIRTPL
ncbi:MAG: DUF2892 domain-containing protein [Verrucomicrobiota bacterium]|nr:DUF2892 domain-containing protein [Verrucomicrobiota bacterium]